MFARAAGTLNAQRVRAARVFPFLRLRRCFCSRLEKLSRGASWSPWARRIIAVPVSVMGSAGEGREACSLQLGSTKYSWTCHFISIALVDLGNLHYKYLVHRTRDFHSKIFSTQTLSSWVAYFLSLVGRR